MKNIRSVLRECPYHTELDPALQDNPRKLLDQEKQRLEQVVNSSGKSP
jgi:hypothetical protein